MLGSCGCEAELTDSEVEELRLRAERLGVAPIELVGAAEQALRKHADLSRRRA
jgi:hypothetical protein